MIEVGQFSIHGDWDETPTPASKHRIIMPPLGHIYGAGWHLTTQKSLALIQDIIKPGMSFLELGAGSCILAIAAEKMGASPVYATEINPEAIEAGREVLEANESKVILVEGTFLDHFVDVAIISISTRWGLENRSKVKARQIFNVNDDATIVSL